MKWTEALQDYSYYLKIERGLSLNSINSYKQDLKKLIVYLEDNSIKISPIKINAEI